MGLIKRNGYTIKGIELPEAYAKINRLYIDKGNIVRSYFAISNTRDNINDGNFLDELMFECYIDKSKPLYEQIYELAKVNNFQGWEDDIVVEEVLEQTTPEEPPIEEVVENNTEMVEEVVEENKMPNETIEDVVTEEVVDNPPEKNTNEKYFSSSEVE